MRRLVILLCLTYALSSCQLARRNQSKTDHVGLVQSSWIFFEGETIYYAATRIDDQHDCWFEHDTRNAQTVPVNFSKAVRISSYDLDAFSALNAEYAQNSSLAQNASGSINAVGCKATGNDEVTQALKNGSDAKLQTFKLSSQAAGCFKAIMWLFKHSENPSILEKKSCAEVKPPAFLPPSLEPEPKR